MKRLLANLFLIIGFTFLYNSSSHGTVFCKGKGERLWGHVLGYKIERLACNKHTHPIEITAEEFVYGFLNAGKSKSINDLNRIKALFDMYNVDKKIINNVISNRNQLSLYRKFLTAEKTQITKAEPKKKEKKISKNDDWIKNLAVEGTETEKNEDLLCLIKRNKGDTYSYFPVDRSEIYKLQNSKYNWQKILAPTNVKYPLTTQEKKELKSPIKLVKN